ncbi:MAG TPA: hypothetical protein GXZ90_07725 [Clostridiales bacterium]|nr:hypothetical protein [Clostridiales bacterium]
MGVKAIISVSDIIVIVSLIISSIQDLKYKKISLWIISLSVILLLALSIYKNNGFINIIGGAIVGFIVISISIITRSKIGIGDGIVLIMTGVVLGFWQNLELLLYALSIAALISIVLLILKKVNKKDSLPFVPFILISYFVVLYFNSKK